LKPKKWVKINVHGYGNVQTTEKVGIVDIELQPVEGKREPIRIEAYMKDGPICAPLTAMKVIMDQCPHLKDLKLSDPDIPEGAEIDILIGQAPLPYIVCDLTRNADVSLPLGKQSSDMHSWVLFQVKKLRGSPITCLSKQQP